jgi:hypothetical protein
VIDLTAEKFVHNIPEIPYSKLERGQNIGTGIKRERRRR